MTHDPVNHPSHYTEGRKYETIDVIDDWQLSYRLGNCVKYVSRAGRKNDAIEDLKKARWYLDREIQVLEGAESPYSVTYQDVLEDAAHEASKGSELLYEYGVTLTQADIDDQPLAYWDTDEDYMWDPSLGPVELTEKEIQEIRDNKDLDQFFDDEIISIIERRGLIIGVKRDGSTCLLSSNGGSK